MLLHLPTYVLTSVFVCLQSDISRLEAKVKEMEETLQFNQQTVNDIKHILHDLAENKEHADWKRLYQLINAADQLKHTQFNGIAHSIVNHTSGLKQIVNAVSEYCRFSESAPSKTDIQVFYDSYLT